MKHVIAILGLIFLFILWLLPPRMALFAPGWGALYIPIVLLTFFWGLVLFLWYTPDFKLK